MNQKNYKKAIWLRKKSVGTGCSIEYKFLTISNEPEIKTMINSTRKNIYVVNAIQYPHGNIVEVYLGSHEETCEPKDWRDTLRFMSVYNQYFECN